MCKFKSGLIFKNRVVLAPKGNESHSDLLRNLNIEDNTTNAMKMFVRAELVPKDNDKSTNINDWKFIVDQDIVPDWFKEDTEKYENMLREEVSDYMKKNYTFICGKLCTAIKTDEKGTYYLLDNALTSMNFGKNNNYATSKVRNYLNDCEFAKKLKEEFGDRLVSITTDLLSLDGLDDYGAVEGDILALPTLDLYRECRKKISNLDTWWWLATPDSTPSGCGSYDVQVVGSFGCVDYRWFGDSRAIRPFFILKNL